MEPIFASLNTLQAKWWEIWMARIFGKKLVATDSGCTVTIYHWRGKSYMTDCLREEH